MRRGPVRAAAALLLAVALAGGVLLAGCTPGAPGGAAAARRPVRGRPRRRRRRPGRPADRPAVGPGRVGPAHRTAGREQLPRRYWVGGRIPLALPAAVGASTGHPYPCRAAAGAHRHTEEALTGCTACASGWRGWPSAPSPASCSAPERAEPRVCRRESTRSGPACGARWARLARPWGRLGAASAGPGRPPPPGARWSRRRGRGEGANDRAQPWSPTREPETTRPLPRVPPGRAASRRSEVSRCQDVRPPYALWP